MFRTFCVNVSTMQSFRSAVARSLSASRGNGEYFLLSTGAQSLVEVSKSALQRPLPFGTDASAAWRAAPMSRWPSAFAAAVAWRQEFGALLVEFFILAQEFVALPVRLGLLGGGVCQFPGNTSLPRVDRSKNGLVK